MSVNVFNGPIIEPTLTLSIIKIVHSGGVGVVETQLTAEHCEVISSAKGMIMSSRDIC